MGECNFALANPQSPVRLVAKEFAFGECAPPAVPVFQLRPGPVTLLSLTEWPGEGFRLVAALAEVVDAPEHPNLDSPHTRLSVGGDLGSFLVNYSRAGGTHHIALAYGDLREDFATLARFCGIGFVVS
jgi:L-arabinose isomerase